MDWSRCMRPHLIGVGGIGVSAVARALVRQGLDVRGTDVRESCITEALREEGVDVTIGQRAENLRDADAVIYSTAVPENNPERVAAVERGLQVLHRSEVLGGLLEGRPSVGVMGTHGKGTVSAAITWLMEQGELSPSFIIGGLLENFGTNTRWQPEGWAVAEVDESDGSLVNVPTRVVCINNLEADHLNYYKNGIEDVLAKFADHLGRHDCIEQVFANVDDAGVRKLMEQPTLQNEAREFVSYGIDNEDARYRAIDLEPAGLATRFTILRDGEPLGRVRLPLPGRYNVNNVMGAVAVAFEQGVSFEAIARGVESFKGLENRFTLVEAGAIRIVKDYISHPTGIRRVLEGAREAGSGRITAVFKPYRFTMVNYLQDDYATAFADAAHTVITELYTAGEVPIPGIDTEFLCDRVRAAGSEVTFVPEMEGIAPFLRENVQDGETVIFFGGDDLFRVADAYAESLV